VNLQVPPNLSQDAYGFFLLSGINDWGGISPVTPDFINPEMAWPQIAILRGVTEEAGFSLRERLTTYPEYIRDPRWIPENLHGAALTWTDEAGLVRREREAA
jgi:FO synthase